MLDDVKTLLGIEDDDLDEKLNIMIKTAGARVLSLLEAEEVPEELEYIVCELTVSRFNRLGNEGMSTFSQDGESMTYGNDLEPYMDAIDAWNAVNGAKGVVRFL
ncbi:MAG: phage head-tail connector protein [Bacteroidales bacterium]|nr:phage head-tail connector protein [Bacteroidales bacterium]